MPVGYKKYVKTECYDSSIVGKKINEVNDNTSQSNISSTLEENKFDFSKYPTLLSKNGEISYKIVLGEEAPASTVAVAVSIGVADSYLHDIIVPILRSSFAIKSY